MSISETITVILRKFVFLTTFERGKSLGKFGFVKTTLFDQTSKMGEILTKTCFSPEIEPYTAKLCFSVDLKNFCGNSQGTSLFIQKVTISETSTETLRKFVFINKFESEQILRKIWICLNNFF